MGRNATVTPDVCSDLAAGLAHGTPYVYLGKFRRIKIRGLKAMQLYALHFVPRFEMEGGKRVMIVNARLRKRSRVIEQSVSEADQTDHMV
jgi:hypothetical protein